MPLIDVSIGSGRTPEQIRRLITDLTEATHQAIGAPLANIRVIVREVDPNLWAAGGVTIAERQASTEGAGT